MRFLRICFLSLFVLAFLIGGMIASTTVFYVSEKKKELPSIDFLANYTPARASHIYANGKEIATLATENREFIAYADIPPMMILAFMAAEDERFWEHNGFDPIAFSRAMITNIKRYQEGNRLHGASTISQQVAQMFVSGKELSVDRKIKDALLAIQIEKQYGKQRVMELYANQIYLGFGAYGIVAAAETYFQKNIADLTIPEYAFIAGLPKAPSAYNPVRFPQAAKERREYVLRRMLTNKMITESQFNEYVDYPLPHPKDGGSGINNHTVEEIRRSLITVLGQDKLYTGGYHIETTYDDNVQKIAQNALNEGVSDYESRQKWEPIDNRKIRYPELTTYRTQHKIPSNLELGFVSAVSPVRVITENGLFYETKTEYPVKVNDIVVLRNREIVPYTGVEGAVLVMKNDGRILSMIGGRDFNASSFNRTSQALRQPGSSFKPIIYLSALEQGMDLESPVLDTPIAIEAGTDRWRPGNYNDKSGGLMSLYNAFIQSKNMATARIVYDLGIDTVLNTANRFGFAIREHNYSMALGASETTMLQMGVMMSAFTNGGYKVTPYLVDSINGKRQNYEKQKIIDDAYLTPMKEMLSGVARKGTAAGSLSKLEGDIGGKTGTTNNAYDAWFAGYYNDYVIIVWVGYDTPQSLGNESGGKVAAPIFRNVVQGLQGF